MDCIINLNKPKGSTSQEVTSEVKKILGAKKAGHTGTLDPAATGVLLVCTDRATRLASFFSELDKQYRAVIKLGESTDTQDAEGHITAKREGFEVDVALIQDTILSFQGKMLQRPPMYSALKYKGKPLYKYAHRGIDIPRRERMIHIHRIELLKIDMPFVTIDVVCSKGTYIRTLCSDIGDRLGVGAHLFELERTAIETFRLQDSVSMDEIRSFASGSPGEFPPRLRTKGIYTMDSALSWMPELYINESQMRSVMNGNPIKPELCPDLDERMRTSKHVKIKSPGGRLLAVGSFMRYENIVKLHIVFGA